MTNIKIVIADEDDVIEEFTGLIDSKDINLLVKESQKKDFSCLSFIDNDQETVFNAIQARVIQEELKELKNKKLNQDMINKIGIGVQKALNEDCTYLKFIPE